MFFLPVVWPSEIDAGLLFNHDTIRFPNGFDVPPGGELRSPYHALNTHTFTPFVHNYGDVKSKGWDYNNNRIIA